jgi:lipopolysaccharide export system permease protein
MTRLQRYLFRNLMVATLYSALGLTLTIWLSQSLRAIELVVEAGAPMELFLLMLVLSVPTFLGIVLPIALMGGLLFTYNRMTMDSELVVMRAAGVGPLALAKPAAIVGAAVAVMVLALDLYLAPAAHQALADVERSVRNDYSQLVPREGVFTDISKGFSVYARKRDQDGNLFNILVHDARNPAKPETTIGERAVIQVGENGPRIVIFNGHKQDLDRATGQLSQLFFDRYAIDMKLATGQAQDRRQDAREQTTADLLNPSPDIRSDERAMRQVVSELHNRLSSPLLALAFTAVAMACLLSGEFNRRGQTARIGLAVVFAILLEGGFLGLTGLSTKTLQVIPLMYLMPLVAMIGGVLVLIRGLGPAGTPGPSSAHPSE